MNRAVRKERLLQAKIEAGKLSTQPEEVVPKVGEIWQKYLDPQHLAIIRGIKHVQSSDGIIKSIIYVNSKGVMHHRYLSGFLKAYKRLS